MARLRNYDGKPAPHVGAEQTRADQAKLDRRRLTGRERRRAAMQVALATEDDVEARRLLLDMLGLVGRRQPRNLSSWYFEDPKW